MLVRVTRWAIAAVALIATLALAPSAAQAAPGASTVTAGAASAAPTAETQAARAYWRYMGRFSSLPDCLAEADYYNWRTFQCRRSGNWFSLYVWWYQ